MNGQKLYASEYLTHTHTPPHNTSRDLAQVGLGEYLPHCASVLRTCSVEGLTTIYSLSSHVHSGCELIYLSMLGFLAALRVEMILVKQICLLMCPHYCF